MMRLFYKVKYVLSRKLGGAFKNYLIGSKRISTWKARTYYLIRADIFGREQLAFVEGSRHFSAGILADRGSESLLRRNIHRLEKGLLMKNRRAVFALEFIGETIDCYEKRLSTAPSGETDPLLAWAHAVLGAYFAEVNGHEKIEMLRARFMATASRDIQCQRSLIPYRRDLSAPPPVAYDELLSLARRRRSVRWFLPKSVPRDLIYRALTIAIESPSACNRQPFLFRLFDDPDLVRQVISVPMGTAGYGENVPAVAVVVGQQRNFSKERDRHLIYVDGALSAMSFALALETLGLGSCLINWPDIEEREARMADLIGLESDERPIMLIAFGYPDPEGLVAASIKKDVDNISRYNFE